MADAGTTTIAVLAARATTDKTPKRHRGKSHLGSCGRCKNDRQLDGRGYCSSCSITFYKHGGVKKEWTPADFVRACPLRHKASASSNGAGRAGTNHGRKAKKRGPVRPVPTARAKVGVADDIAELHSLRSFLSRGYKAARLLNRVIAILKGGDAHDLRKQVHDLTRRNKSLNRRLAAIKAKATV